MKQLEDKKHSESLKKSTFEYQLTENRPPKLIRIYVDVDIEFTVDISNDWLTCGWLLSEVTRKYTDALQKIMKEKEEQMLMNGKSSGTSKQMKKFIVALKTTDQRESLDYLLTQYDRQDI